MLPHPQLSLPHPPIKEPPKIPPSPPHAHERMRRIKIMLQLQFPPPLNKPPLLHVLLHPHPVAAKSLIVSPPVNFVLQYTDIQYNLFCLLKILILINNKGIIRYYLLRRRK
jgi:hypothetical protein